MAQVIWSPQSVSDLDSICMYIARDSERYARFVAASIVELVESLSSMPLLDWTVPEYNQPEIRERLYRNYRIVYRARADVIEVITITHGARPLPKTLPE